RLREDIRQRGARRRQATVPGDKEVDDTWKLFLRDELVARYVKGALYFGMDGSLVALASLLEDGGQYIDHDLVALGLRLVDEIRAPDPGLQMPEAFLDVAETTPNLL